jgi:hypothetical protein
LINVKRGHVRGEKDVEQKERKEGRSEGHDNEENKSPTSE